MNVQYFASANKPMPRTKFGSSAITAINGPAASAEAKKAAMAIELISLCAPGYPLQQTLVNQLKGAQLPVLTYVGETPFAGRSHVDWPELFIPIESDIPVSKLKNQLELEDFSNLFQWGLISGQRHSSYVDYQAHPLIAMAVLKGHGDIGRVESTRIHLPPAFQRQYPNLTKLFDQSLEQAQPQLREVLQEITRHNPNFFQKGSPGTLLKPILDILTQQ